MKLRDLMIQNVMTTTPDSMVSEAARLMGQKAIGAIVVVQNGGVAGILTERDILLKIAAEGKDTRQTRVRDIMTHPVLTMGPDEDLDRAIQTMGEKKIRRLPIVEGGRLVGIVTSTDVLLNLKRELVEFAESAEATLATTSKPASPTAPPRGLAAPAIAILALGSALSTWGALSYSLLAAPATMVNIVTGWALPLLTGILLTAISLLLISKTPRRTP
ncbi:MAG: CBS domain-containing protein [Euryarchaeota archaeon]|nr:CBS domain-containing protein [Euryarchaeota archaeon]